MQQRMSTIFMCLAASLGLGALACEKQTRTPNSQGASALTDPDLAPASNTTPVAVVPHVQNGGQGTAAPAPTKPEETAPAETPPAPETAVTAEDGKLSVTSNPAGLVFVDDNLVGRTPIVHKAFPVGRHVVEIRADGYDTQRREVQLTRMETKVSVALTKAEAPAPVASLKPVAMPQKNVIAPPHEAPAHSAPAAAPVISNPAVPPPPVVTVTSAAAPPAAPTVSATVSVAKVEPVPAPKPEIQAPRLPAVYAVTAMKDLARVLSITESEAIERGGVPSSVASGVTRELAQVAFDQFSPGQTITLHPRAMYYVIVNGAKAGKSGGAIAGDLRRAYTSNSW